MKLTVHKNNIFLNELVIHDNELITGTEFIVGRSDECHLCIQDHKISRHHFSLIVKEDGLYFQKLTQMGEFKYNGSFLNEGKANNHDRFQIGEFVIAVIDYKNPFEESITQKIQLTPDPVKVAEPLPVQLEPVKVEETQNSEIEQIENSDESFNTDNFTNNDEMPTDEIQDESNSFSEAPIEESTPTNRDEQENTNDSFSDSDSGGEKTQMFNSFASYSLLIQGEFAPFDRYKIDDNEIYIGRDSNKCQIPIADTEASSVHAVIKKSLVNLTIEDLKSTNGTILNGERINKAELSNGDVIQIGTTTFTVEIKNDLLESESDRLMPVEENQFIETEEIIEEEVSPEELGDFGEIPQEKGLKALLKDPKKKKIVYAVVGILVVLLLLPNEEKPKDEAAKDGKSPQEKGAEADKAKEESKKQINKEDLALLEGSFQLARAYNQQGKYSDALVEIEKIEKIDRDYKQTQTLKSQAKTGLKRLEELNKEKQAAEERAIRAQKVGALVDKAKEAVKDRQVLVAESLFNQIFELDPENIDVPQLKLEIDAYKKSEEEKALEEARKKAERQKMVDALSPGKNLYLKGDFYRAIIRLEEFLSQTSMDEDLIKEADTMLKDSKRKLAGLIEPLIGKARSFKEGQDLKMSYETYGEVLRFDPVNDEALNERDMIRDVLEARAKKIFREAMISESLSLFAEAKEKYQEVQQISPINSEYYKKATDKLKRYLE